MHQGIDQLFWDAVSLDAVVDLALVVAVIAQCIEDLSQCEMRQMQRDGFWREALPP